MSMLRSLRTNWVGLALLFALALCSHVGQVLQNFLCLQMETSFPATPNPPPAPVIMSTSSLLPRLYFKSETGRSCQWRSC